MEFSIRSAVRFGWETFKRRPWLLIVAMLLIAIAQILVEGFGRAIDALFAGSAEEPPIAVALINLAIYFALSTLISMGTTAFFLAAHDNPETVELSALWHPQPFWKYLGLSILFLLVVVAGLLVVIPLGAALGPVVGTEGRGILAAIPLLIVLGLVFSLMFMFAGFLVVDRELAPIEAMKESYRISRGHKWKLFGLLVVLSLINLLGLLALIIGLFVSVPVSLLALTHAYRVLARGARPTDATLAA